MDVGLDTSIGNINAINRQVNNNIKNLNMQASTNNADTSN